MTFCNHGFKASGWPAMSRFGGPETHYLGPFGIAEGVVLLEAMSPTSDPSMYQASLSISFDTHGDYVARRAVSKEPHCSRASL
jgi:hypothetical protein